MGQFTQETAVERLAEDHWRGELHEGWRLGAVPNGGYVLAVAGRVLSQALPHPDPLTVNAYFLAPTGLGPIDCRVEVLRAGRASTQAQLRMYQEDELKVLVTAAFTDLDRLEGESWSARPRPQLPPIEECAPGAHGGVEFKQRVDIRMVGGASVFTERRPDGSGEFSGWVQHRDRADPDALSMLMFADSFPPPVFTVYGLVRWVPTVELSVQVRAHPAPGPLQARFYTRHLSRGVLEEDGEFWDSSGQLVALSRQTAKFRLPPDKRKPATPEQST